MQHGDADPARVRPSAARAGEVTALSRPPAPARQGRSPSAGDGGRAGQSPVLACGSCPRCRPPSDSFIPPSLSCAWLQDPVPTPQGGGNKQNPPTGLKSSVVKKKKKDKNAAKQSQRPLFLQLHCAMGGWTRGGQPLACPLSWGWWPGEPGRWHVAPSPPPQPPLHPPCFLTTFERFFVIQFCTF